MLVLMLYTASITPYYVAFLGGSLHLGLQIRVYDEGRCYVYLLIAYCHCNVLAHGAHGQPEFT